MREVLAILNDRITVNSINGKAEAVSALSELREAIMGPIQRMELDLALLVQEITRTESCRKSAAWCDAIDLLKHVRKLQTGRRE